MSREKNLQSRGSGGLSGRKAHAQGWEPCLAQGKLRHSGYVRTNHTHAGFLPEDKGVTVGMGGSCC